MLTFSVSFLSETVKFAIVLPPACIPQLRADPPAGIPSLIINEMVSDYNDSFGKSSYQMLTSSLYEPKQQNTLLAAQFLPRSEQGVSHFRVRWFIYFLKINFTNATTMRIGGSKKSADTNSSFKVIRLLLQAILLFNDFELQSSFHAAII